MGNLKDISQKYLDPSFHVDKQVEVEKQPTKLQQISQKYLEGGSKAQEVYEQNRQNIQDNWQKGIDEYNLLPNNPDFATTSLPIEGINNDRYKLINGGVVYGDPISEFDNAPSETRFEDDQEINQMNETERRIYTHLYNQEGQLKADEYIRQLQPILNKRRQDKFYNAETQEGKVADMSNGQLVGGNIASVGALPMSAVSSIDIASQKGRQIVDSIMGRTQVPIDYNTPAQAGTNYRNAIREETSSRIENPITNFLYQTGMSIADSTVGVLLASAGIPNPGLLLGMDAGIQSAKEAKARGLSDNEALLTGLFAGIAEEFFEEYSIDRVLTDGLPIGGKAKFINMLKQMGVEGSEEVFTSIANRITDGLINADRSQIQQDIQRLVAQGYTLDEATKAVEINFAKQLALDFLGGAVSGGVFGLGANIKSDINAIGKGSKYIADNAKRNQLINESTALGGKSQEYASKIKDDNSLKSRRQLGYLESLNQYETTNKAVEKAQNDYGMKADTMTLRSLQKQANGENLTPFDEARIKKYNEQYQDLAKRINKNDVKNVKNFVSNAETTQAQKKETIKQTKAFVESRKASDIVYYKSSENELKVKLEAMKLGETIRNTKFANELVSRNQKIVYDVERFKGHERNIGFYDTNTNEIVLNPLTSFSDQMRFVTAHEIIHDAKAKGKQSYDDLVKMYLENEVKYEGTPTFKNGKLVNDGSESYKELRKLLDLKKKESELYKNDSDEVLLEERVAKYIEDMAGDTDNAELIFKDQTKAKSFLERINGVINKFAGVTDNANEQWKKLASIINKGLDAKTETKERFVVKDGLMVDSETGEKVENPTDFNDSASMQSTTTLAEGIGLDVKIVGGVLKYYNRLGNQVTKVSKKNIENSAIGNLIRLSIQEGTITEAQAKKQVESITDLMNMVLEVQEPDLIWAYAGAEMFSALKSNADSQYTRTIDFTTICRKTENMITAISNAMVEKAKKNGKGGLTKEEIIELQNDLINEGSQVPCPVCYVFSRWAGVGSILDGIYELQEMYKGASKEEVRATMQNLENEILKEQNSSQKKKSKAINDLLKKKQEELDKLNAERQSIENTKGIGYETALESVDRKIANVEKEIRPLLKYSFAKIFLKDSYKPVPSEILYDLNRAEDFARDYPDVWKFRTTRGSGAGKAILPYSDMRFGDIILGYSGKVEDIPKRRENFGELGEVLTDSQRKAFNTATKNVKAQNLLGGERFQSTSDFRYEYALDYFMAFLELQAIGSNMQTYTKIIEFADLVGAVGGDGNLSLMPLNAGYKDGHLIFSSVTGMNFEVAKKARAKYDSIQTILVGINEKHIRLALKDSEETLGLYVDFVIPYHASGASIDKFVTQLLANLNEQRNKENYQDFAPFQEDSKNAYATEEQLALRDARKIILTGRKDGRKAYVSQELLNSLPKKSKDITNMSFDELYDIELKALGGDKEAIKEYKSWSSGVLYNLYQKMNSDEYKGVYLTSGQAGKIMPHEYWDKSTTRKNAYVNGFIFRSYCYSLGLTPRFSTRSSKVNADFTNEDGYWKLLIDRPMYNNDGTYREQNKINITNLKKEMLTEDYGEKEWGGVDSYGNKYRVDRPDKSKAIKASEDFLGRHFSDTEVDASPLTDDERALKILEMLDKTFSESGNVLSPRHIRNLFNEDESYDYIDRILYKEDTSVEKELKNIVMHIGDAKTMNRFEDFYIEYARYKYRNTIEYGMLSQKRLDQAISKFKKYIKNAKELVGSGTNLQLKKGKYSLETTRKLFDQLNTSNEMKSLADKVFNVAGQLGANIYFVNKSDMLSGRDMREMFGEAWTDIVHYNLAYFNSRIYTNEQKAKTILHELIHTCTALAIDVYNHPSIDITLTPKQTKAVEVIKEVYNVVKNSNDFVGEYGIKNEKEMLAELSNAKFAEKLKKKNLWTRLIEAIKNFFGIETKTAHDALYVSLEQLLQSASKQQMEEYSKYASRTKTDEDLKYGGIRYSDTQLDAEYMDAVNKGDTKTAQKLVDRVAKENGYTIKAYHGTRNIFTIFDKTKSNKYNYFGENGFYFSNKESEANNYASKNGEFTDDVKAKIEDEVLYRFEELGYSYEDLESNEHIKEYNEIYDKVVEEFSNNSRTINVFLKIENPAYYNGKGFTDANGNKIDGIVNGEEAQSLEALGYDGIIDNSRGGYNSVVGRTHYVVFNPSQIKSADAITYDDNGNVIPLSERFNDSNNDIRWSDSTFNANSGYDGYSMSNRAREAYENGEMPLSKWTKEEILNKVMELNPSLLDDIKGFNAETLKKNLLKWSSWHHTSKYYNPTAFYSINENYLENLTKDEIKDWEIVKSAKPNIDSKDITSRADEIYTKLQVIFSSPNNNYKTFNGLFRAYRDGKIDIDKLYAQSMEDIISNIKENDSSRIAQWEKLPDGHWRKEYIDMFNNNIEKYIAKEHGIKFIEYADDIPRREKEYQQIKSLLQNEDIRWSDTQLDENDPIYQELLEVYGIMPKGANRTNTVDVPKATATGNVRRFAQSQMESPFSDKKYETKVKKAIADNLLSYKVEGDASAIDYANKTLADNKFEGALKIFNNAIATDNVDKKTMVLGQRLWIESAQKKDYDTMLDIGSTLAVQGTRAGQMIQSLNLIKKFTPQGQLMTLEKYVDQMNKDREKDPKVKKELEEATQKQQVIQKDIDKLQKKIDDKTKKNQLKEEQINKLNEEIAKLKEEYDKLKKQTSSDTAKIVRRNQKLQTLDSQIKQLTKNLNVVESHLENLDNEVNQMNELKKKLNEVKKTINKYKVTLDDATIQNILNAQTRGELDRAVEQAYVHIAEQVPSTWLDKWNAWRYMSMLTNPTTHIRNIVGNLTFIPAMELKNLITYGLQEKLGNKIGLDEKTTLKVEQKYKDEALKVYEENTNFLMSSGKYNANDIISENRRIFQTQAIETVRKLNGKFLEAEDGWFLKKAFVKAYSRYMQANPNADKQKAFDYAKNEAWKATYRDASVLAEKINAFAKTNAGTEILVGAILPFKKTPINILKRGIEYSPIGLFKSVYDMTYGLKHPEKFKDLTPAKALDELASGLSGTIIMLIGMLLARWGLLNGKGDDESTAYEKQTTGFQPFSMNLGKYTYTLDWMSPTAMPLFVGVEIHNALQNDFEFKGMIEALYNIPAPLFEMSLLSGLGQVIDQTKYAESTSEKAMLMASTALTSYLGQALPTLGRRLASIADANIRNVYYNNKKTNVPKGLQAFGRQAVNKIPFASKSLEPKIDVWGREITSGGSIERHLEALISPGYWGKYQATRVDEAIIKLYQATGDARCIPNTSRANYYKVDGESKYMDANQYTAYSRTEGKTKYKEANSLISSSWYKSLSDKEKVDALSEIYSYSKWYALRNNFRDYTNDEYDKTQALLEKTGMTYAQYYGYYKTYKDLADSREYTVNKDGEKEYKQTASDVLKKYLLSTNLNQYQCQEIYRKIFPNVKKVPSFAK